MERSIGITEAQGRLYCRVGKPNQPHELVPATVFSGGGMEVGFESQGEGSPSYILFNGYNMAMYGLGKSTPYLGFEQRRNNK